MAEEQKEPISVPKKKVIRCDQICTYVGGGKEPRRCKHWFLGACPRINRCFPVTLLSSLLGSPLGSPGPLAGLHTPLGAHW